MMIDTLKNDIPIYNNIKEIFIQKLKKLKLLQ